MNTLRMCTLLVCLATSLASVAGARQTESKNNLVLLPVSSDPTISFRVWFKVGSEDDPAGKEGLSRITAQMLTDAATTKNSYERVLDKLFPLAAGYNAACSAEMTVITGRTHKDNLKPFYTLYTDAILHPAFRQDDLDRIKSEVLNYLENQLRYASDEELGKAVLYNNLFAGSGYGHITQGLIESVKSITLADVTGFYKKHYTRDNLVIGLGGGYDATLVKTVQKDLAGLPQGAPPQAPKPVPVKVEGMAVTIVEKDAASTAISLGFPINVLRGEKDWYALAIANSWLGEHRNSSSHLYQVIRERRGLNYGDYSYIENFPNAGMSMSPPQNVCRRQQIFEVWIRPVPSETRHFALRAALRELKKLVDNGMSQEDFDLTRKFLRNYVLQYAPTTMERLGYAIDDAFYGIQGSHLETFRKMMDQITLADVNAAIKKHLQYQNLQIAIVTKNAQALKDSMLANAPSPITYPGEKPQALLDEDKEISTFPLALKPENIKIVPVTELFQK